MSDKPPINVTDVGVHDASLTLLEALVDANDGDDPRLFARTGGLARVIPTDHGHVMQPLDDRRLLFEAEQACDWFRWAGRAPNKVEVPTKADKDIVYHLGDMGHWPGLPELDTLLQAPCILPDGRILNGQGYDRSSNLYMAVDPSLVMPPLVEDPSADDAHQASLVLQEPYSEMRFASAADAGNAHGFLVAHPLRTLMGRDARLPLFLWDAPTAGSGKGLGINCGSIIATGREADSQFLSGGRNADEEARKLITAILLGGRQFVHLDNLEVSIRSAALSALLTAEVWSDRELGKSFHLELPISTTFAASGNNLQVGGDMGRRVVAIRIDTGFQMPFLRTFQRMDLLGYVRHNRGRLLHAILTLAKRWVQQGRPLARRVIMGSFQPFADVIGGILETAEIDGWLGNLLRFAETENTDLAEWTRFIHAWHALWGDQPVLAKTVAEACLDTDGKYADLRDAMPAMVRPYTEVERAKLALSLGNFLKARADQIFDGLQLQRAGADRTKTVLWRVKPHGSAGAGPTVVPPENAPPRARTRDSGSSAGAAGAAGPQVHPLTRADIPLTDEMRTREGATTPPAAPAAPARPPRNARARPPVRVSAPHAYAHVALEAFMQRLSTCTLAGLDTETFNRDPERTALHPWHGARIRLLQVATADEVQVIDLFQQPDALEILKPVLEGSGPVLAMHNAKFDLAMLRAHGVNIPPRGKVFDTYLASLLLDNSDKTRPKQSLKALAERYLGRDLPKELANSDWAQDTLTDEQMAYAAEDARATYDLARILQPLVAEHKLTEAYEIELAVLPTIIGLHERGVRIDPALWLPLAEVAQRERDRAEAELEAVAGKHNWASWQQVQRILIERGIDIPSTAESYLQDHADDAFVKALLHYREWNKGVTTYGVSVVKACTADERFHAEYNQADTRTGRMTADVVHQMPRVGGYREAVRPVDGRCLVKCDYSQLQLVIVADLADDRSMIQAFQSGIDIHAQTASLVFGGTVEQVSKDQRQQAKALNFGLVFGGGAEKLQKVAVQYGVHWTLEDATLLRDKFFRAYPGLRRWHREPQHQSAEPLDIRSKSGRRRRSVERFTQKVNTPVQMLEVDGVKSGLVVLEERIAELGLDAQIVLIVHDEIDLECPINQAQQVADLAYECLTEAMNRWLKRARATIDVSIQRDWAGTKIEGLE